MSPVDIRPAVRKDTQVLILLAGGTGAGKTESALRLATGMAGGQRFAVIDTERGRALHKADDYVFDHVDFDAPFTPERYAEILEEVDKLGYPVIVVDSGSHEYEGEGGVLDIQEETFKRLGGRDSVKMVSWAEAKQRHKKWRNALLRARAHVIVCHRAEDKIEVGKDAAGKTVIRPKESLTGSGGWIPICEKRLPFEATISLLFTADAPGVPKPIKLERRHADLIPLDQQISEETGALLAAWAHGSGAGTPGRAAVARSTEEEPNRPVEPAVAATNGDVSGPSFPPNVVPGTEGVRFATEAQRKRLFAISKEHGVEAARLREILGEITGQESTAQIPSALYDKVIAAIEAEEVVA